MPKGTLQKADQPSKRCRSRCKGDLGTDTGQNRASATGGYRITKALGV